MPFIDTFRNRGNISFHGMRSTAQTLLPSDNMQRSKLYNDLKRGTGILDDEDHLNMYLHSFGKMHKAKLDTAFRCLPLSEGIFEQELEVYDWGCGQGTATICLLDFLKEKKINARITAFNLIDPSTAAVNRAEQVINCYGNFVVNKTIKIFDELIDEDLTSSRVAKLHLFSNILDVDAFDLARFIQLFQRSFGGENYFVCVGPYYCNNKRVDEFIAATEPDTMYAIANKEKGEWLNEWTISLRVFFKDFHRIESVQDIRKRIEESHKKGQFFAGYILDAVAEEFKGTEIEEETEALYNALSAFDVKSNIALEFNTECDSKLAVLANIISRGLPTKAPILLENLFSELFQVSKKPDEDSVLEYHSTHSITAQSIYEALHVIDPRFNAEFYNGDMLESTFERTFVEDYLKGTEAEYLIQLLEPQRMLSSIVSIPDRRFSKDQRVDFALEIPYGESKTGFIVEMDGIRYHSNIFQRIRDERRDRMASNNGWDTYRIENLETSNFITSWSTESSSCKYLQTVKKNFSKELTGNWKNYVQIVLAPLAIARVERMLVEAMMSGALDTQKDNWDIIIIERDVPCAVIAIQDFIDKYSKICKLAGESEKIPNITLCVVSTTEFCNSPLHIGHRVVREIPYAHYDLCIDISMLLRDNIDALPLNVDAEAIYLIRSSHYKKNERIICAAENIIYPALVKKDSTGKYVNIKEREEVLTYFLQDIFRKPSFRNGQLPIISHILADKTTIGLLPTGGGKSLTYQLSCLLQPGVSIIVDPLVSLMVDQVRGLKDIRIDACECVHSGLRTEEKMKKLSLLQQGATQFMLLSPERFMMENFRDNLITMSEKNHVYFSYGVIDEVHCVSEWGHDFRTSYLHLGRNMINYMRTKSQRPLSVVGLTATASFDVLADVERELTLGGNLTIDSETIVRPENDTRPELTYRILKVDSNFDELRDPVEYYKLKSEKDWDLKNIVAETKLKKLYSLFDTIPSDIETINITDSPCHIDGFEVSTFYDPDENDKYQNAGILFCPHARGTFGVLTNVWNTRPGISDKLIENVPELKIGTFVGGDKPSGDMRSFNENDQNIMVATKAFGMGIDKPNVRYTIHFNHPTSIESYVQEAGRGGRDRKHAISYVLYDSTEYVHLTADKINDIRYHMGQENDPTWLLSYTNRFILLEDFPELCRRNNANEEQIENLLHLLHTLGFLENVDKNINLYFHNNSFRGLYKEKVILNEMTDRILNVSPSYITEVQGKLRDRIGNTDVCLRVDKRNNAIRIYSEEENQDQYGYLYLDRLKPIYRHVNFELQTCQFITQALINILHEEYPQHSADDLLRPLEGEDNITEGIYSAMEHADANGYVYVTVTWENQVKQDPEEFERNIREEISNIAAAQHWLNLNEERNDKLSLNNIDDFNELLQRISKCSDDVRWLQNHASRNIFNTLKRIFCKKRDKDDTDKAIYRMCCIGLVEDVTIDYLAQTYELKVKRQSDQEYKQHMLEFFRKYYSLEQAQRKVDEIDNHIGRNYLDKCLGYLTEFVYSSLEKKRYRAIDDMRLACEDGYTHRIEDNNDDWLKEFIHLYFNSKYARRGYIVNGDDYCLSDDTDSEGRDDFDIVRKYINVIPIDNSGSEIDNVKHLYGATLLCLRAHPENAALQLLLSYCIVFQGPGNNETLKANAFNGYVDGFIAMYENIGNDVWKLIEEFNTYLRAKAHADYDIEDLIAKSHESLLLYIHGQRLNDIAIRYLEKATENNENIN